MHTEIYCSANLTLNLRVDSDKRDRERNRVRDLSQETGEEGKGCEYIVAYRTNAQYTVKGVLSLRFKD